MKNIKKEIESILLANNSNAFSKYPIGNKELVERMKVLEDKGKIHYDAMNNRWLGGIK